jgi:ParB family chromosome partitioning protein
MAERKAKVRKRRGVKLKPTELTPNEVPLTEIPEELSPLAKAIQKDGGVVLATYREPLGGHALVFAALPTEKVEPTAYQRDVSDAHVRRLTLAMDKTKRFLDPIIAVHGEDGGYLTPNGLHRLTALKELGAKTVLALVVPEPEVAHQILALNIEKAYNLREKALEVVRLYRELLRLDAQLNGKKGEIKKESAFELEFEEPALVTLGFGYEKRPRLSGGAYHPVLRRVDHWIDAPLEDAVEIREKRAALVLELDDAVTAAVAKLKEKGLTSPYLKPFVIARVNPLRFIKGEPPALEDLLPQMTKRARGLNTDKIKVQDIARTGGPPPEAEAD